MTKLSKKTEYRGIMFRSRLKADFAEWFDSMGIIWSYEPQGYKLSNGQCYLPDFFLPQQKAWFECKGVMLPEDETKILTLAEESGLDVFVGSHIYDGEILLQVVDAYNEDYTLYRGEIQAARCRHCGKVWLMSEWGSWACRVCGAYDGNGHFDVIASFPGWGRPILWRN